MLRKVFIAIFTLLLTQAFAQVEITPNEVLSHIAYLADDDKKGRFPCTPESHIVADYIRSDFVKNGLQLLADSGFQYFDIAIDAKLKGENYLKIGDSLYKPDRKTYLPFPFSATGEFKADTVVFVGYGFDFKSGDTLIWNDYQNVDVHNKWVLILRGYPKDTLNDKIFNRQKSERSKASIAQKYGAKGIIFITLPDQKLIPFKMPRFSVKFNIAILEINDKIAEQILGIKAKDLVKALKLNPHYHFLLVKPVKAKISYEIIHCKAKNVVALVKSNDPQLGDRYIIVGAHYDHLGMGGYESGSRMPDTIAVHNGADDNASGTAGVLELAEYIAANRDKLRRSVIFVTFDAEERGLLGSDYFAKHPPVDKSKIDFMINMDMIGKYNGSASVMGVGTAAQARQIFESIQYDTTKIKVKLHDKAYGGSDHASFISQGIPAVFFYSSSAEYYHTPNDDVQYIKPKEEAEILKYIAKLIIKLSQYPDSLTFVKQEDQTQGGKYSQGVKLGIRPSFTYEGKGLKIDGIVAGGTAEKYGLQPGDIIIGINTTKIENIYDYMNAMQNFSPGDKAVITVLRSGKKVKIKVKF